jgi:hypothetical protein
MIKNATALLLLFVALYGLVKAYPLISGPRIQYVTTIQSADPATGPTFTTISGTAIHTETLTMDGVTLLINKEGSFSKTLTLPRGNGILTLTATDRFGRSQSSQESLIIP